MHLKNADPLYSLHGSMHNQLRRSVALHGSADVELRKVDSMHGSM